MKTACFSSKIGVLNETGPESCEEQLQKQLLVLKAQAARLQDEKTAAMPIDKAFIGV